MKTLTNPLLSASLRIIDQSGDPWFVAKDILETLGIAQPTNQAIEKLDEDEVTQTYVHDSLGREQMTYIVSESGLYSLILRSDKPAARAFRRWVTSEVLPEIRRAGKYSAGWETRLAELEGGYTAARNRMVDAAEELRVFRAEMASRLGLPCPSRIEGPNQSDQGAVSEMLREVVERMPLPLKTLAAVKWLMTHEALEEKAARMRIWRMYRQNLIKKGPKNMIHKFTSGI